jgi:ribonuclease P protein component
MDFSLPKKYKLCSLKKIEHLYSQGKLVKAFPIRILYLFDEVAPEDNEAHTPAFQVLFSAPKRKFKRAHDRNYIKRCMKEILRHQKPLLESTLSPLHKKVVFSITFNGTERPDYKFLEQKLQKALHQFIQEIKS